MNVSICQILEQIDSQIAAKHLLTHPFYHAWSKGELSKECLADYAAQYYHHVKAFPTYLSALHSHTDDSQTRRHILQNLVDEEAGHPNHPEMWRHFALSLGQADEELDRQEPRAAIQEMIASFSNLCRDGSVAEGIAALYAYESQIPSISESKIEGLLQHYGMNNPKDWYYFSVHIEADKEHAAVERELLAKHVTRDNAQAVKNAVEQILDGLWAFLDSLCEKYQISCTMPTA